jgi:hypothetical protein
MPDPLAKPPPQPDISDIPQATQLQQQLDTLNQAIAALQAGGNVNYLTVCAAPPPPPDPGMPPQPPSMIASEIRVSLNPPLTDAGTLADLAAALQAQADVITQQLTDMGYTNTARRK